MITRTGGVAGMTPPLGQMPPEPTSVDMKYWMRDQVDPVVVRYFHGHDYFALRSCAEAYLSALRDAVEAFQVIAEYGPDPERGSARIARAALDRIGKLPGGSGND